MDFNNRQEYGNIGEKIVVDYLEDTGNIVYSTTTPTAHPVDFFCYNVASNSTFAVEVKTKELFRKYKAYSIDDKHLSGYKSIDSTTPLQIYFVDRVNKKISGGDLDFVLRDSYKINEDNNYTMICENSLRVIKHLSDEEVSKLK